MSPKNESRDQGPKNISRHPYGLSHWLSLSAIEKYVYIYIYTLHGTITYPIWGKGKSSTQKCRLGQGDMLVPWRVYTYIASDKIGEVLREFALLCSMQQHFISANIDTLLMAKILHQLIGSLSHSYLYKVWYTSQVVHDFFHQKYHSLNTPGNLLVFVVNLFKGSFFPIQTKEQRCVMGSRYDYMLQ